MKQDRFLLFIIIGILALVGVALVVFFTRQTTILEYQADDQPRGVVFNYLLALDKGDYEKAYGYISDISGKPTLIKFRQTMAMNKSQFKTNAVDVTEESIDGQTATVLVVTTMAGGGPFDRGFSNTENASLELVDGKWRIISMPYEFWSYDWNQPVIK
jgi:hypothetical protein